MTVHKINGECRQTPQFKIDWACTFIWFGVIPALGLLELWGIYELANYFGLIDAIITYLRQVRYLLWWLVINKQRLQVSRCFVFKTLLCNDMFRKEWERMSSLPIMAQHKYWASLPARPTPRKFTTTERLFGPMYSHLGLRLGIVGRLLYGWFYTDDPYFDRVDQELRDKGL